jgi:hypothetical protein
LKFQKIIGVGAEGVLGRLTLLPGSSFGASADCLAEMISFSQLQLEQSVWFAPVTSDSELQHLSYALGVSILVVVVFLAPIIGR